MKSHYIVARMVALNVFRFSKEKPGRAVRQHRMNLNQLRQLYDCQHRLPPGWFVQLQFFLAEIGYIATMASDAEIIITEQVYVESMVKLSAKRVSAETSMTEEQIEAQFKAEWVPSVWSAPARSLQHVDEE